jgi:hypothetical protein
VASNKNQHFVPRCYLRQFTIDEADRAINLYNIDRDLFIPDAPVRSQCSGDYFYGKDPLLEEAMQSIERPYGGIAKEILEPGYHLTDQHREFLKLFWLLQYLRTEAASKRAVEMSEAMASAIDKSQEDFRLQIRDAIQMAMRAFTELMKTVSDLKVCLIRNRSNTPFVTSDDPAVLTNRWYLQSAPNTGLSFGLRNAGDLLLLPISSTVLCLGYDGDVYSVSHVNGWADIRRDADADAFNQQQYVNCRANLFVRKAEFFDIIRAGFKGVSMRRPAARHRMNYAVLDKEDGEYSRYVVVDREQARPHAPALIHVQAVHTAPAAWPSVLAWRSGACAFSNGTGIGYVRRAFSGGFVERPFRKVRAGPAT